MRVLFEVRVLIEEIRWLPAKLERRGWEHSRRYTLEVSRKDVVIT